MKQCTKCKLKKPPVDFGNNKTRPDGLSCWCKLCSKINSRKYYQDNKEQRSLKAKEYYKDNKEKAKKYYKQNKEKISIREKLYRQKNKKEIAVRTKAYRQKNKEEIAKKDAIHYKKNKERINARQRAWDAANSDKRREREAARRDIIREQQNAYYKENKDKILKAKRMARRLRRKTDPTFRLEANLRSRTNGAIKNNSKSKSTIELLGCTVEHARKHLESQFTDGMNWETYGFYGWHIDHIIPCASFDLSIPEQQRQCFHFTNLQPLWAKDNLSKNDKLPDQHQPELPISIHQS